MKKFIFILILGLSLHNNAFSKITEKKQSIIYCADKDFLSLEFAYLKGLTSLYLLDSEILKLNKEIDILQERINNKLIILKKNTAEWISKNTSTLPGSGMQELDNCIKENDKSFDKEMDLSLQI